jgi:hypothetical protein
MTDQDATQLPKQRRSPGFPSIDLSAALERARDLYRVSPKHPVPLAVAAEEWGYSPKSSTNLITAAALKRYGLVRDVGSSESRQLALTEDGRELAFLDQDRDESPRWSQLVREAALRPKIHRQVLDHFGGPLPDDRVVLQYLLFELGFADEAAAKAFLRELRATLRFAGIDGSEQAEPSAAEPQSDGGRLAFKSPGLQVAGSPAPVRAVTQRPYGGGEVQPAAEAQEMQPAAGRWPGSPSLPAPVADRASVQIPYSPGQWASLRAPFPLTEQDWAAMIAMLQAMKPGLVADEPPRPQPAPGDDSDLLAAPYNHGEE